MLKPNFPPILSNFTHKSTTPHFPAVFSSGFGHRLSTVRRNASTAAVDSPTTTTTPTLPHQLPPTSAYVHLPFCRKRCHYCDFPVVALGSSSPSPHPADADDPRISDYIRLLSREIKATHSSVVGLGRSTPASPLPLRTVFFGGGTPSLVPPRLVASILHLLTSKFGLTPDAEISMEMDPGTFDANKVKELMALGVNRISLGVQAFQDAILKACGRAHTLREVYEAIEIVGSCGVQNWSMDLISSLPHQTPEMWEESLNLTIQAQPNHVSVYDLQVEQGTKFGTLYTPGEFPLPSETQSANFYKMASNKLSGAGYDHYEISSYCKKGFECKHNLTYWKNLPFHAFGLGSASFLGGVRFSRPRRMKEYQEYVQNLEISGGLEKKNDTVMNGTDMAMDVVMLSLRTARGLDLKEFGEAFGDSLALSLCRAYRPYVESGHVICLDGQRVLAGDEFNSLVCSNEHDERIEGLGHIRLSDPEGFLLSNELISIAFREMAP